MFLTLNIKLPINKVTEGSSAVFRLWLVENETVVLLFLDYD